MKIRFVRVSTEEQSLGLQRDALFRDEVARVFVDQASGTSKYRPGVGAVLEMLVAHAERRPIDPLSRFMR